MSLDLCAGRLHLGQHFYIFEPVLLTLRSLATNIIPLTPRILPILIQILMSYQKDPATIVGLALKLLQPVPFTRALTLASEDSLIQALQSPSPSMNILAIAVIEKAARSPGDTAILSVMRVVVKMLLRTWLSSPHVEVGERAAKALGDLLSMDCDHRTAADLDSRMHGLKISSRTPPGQGLLWRRIFQDSEIYQSIFDLCSFRTVGSGEGQLDERQKSLAQARLLRILPRLATLNFSAISKTDFHDIEHNYGMTPGSQGILWFAATDMVNCEEDVLMHMMVIDFFSGLLEAVSEITPVQSTLDYLALLGEKAIASDNMLRQALEDLEVDPMASAELQSLLSNLKSRRRLTS